MHKFLSRSPALQKQKPNPNTVQFHLHEFPRIVKIIDTENRMVVDRNWEEGKGSHSFTGTVSVGGGKGAL
jgi:hypothetical protein